MLAKMFDQNASMTKTPQRSEAHHDDDEHTQKQNANKNCRGQNRSSSSNNNISSRSNNGMWLASVVILICLLASGISKTNAVPTDSRDSNSFSSRNSNSRSSSIGDNNDSVGAGIRYQHAMREEQLNAATASAAAAAEQAVAASSSSSSLSSSSSSSTELQTEQQQPQGQCLLEGLWVPEHTVHCEKKPGCRAIQKTGHCCPDYKCDCEKDGKTYMNGDKLVDLGTPCTVCYCKGGEIQCSSVTCFHRDDCKPKYVPGRCCPEYDNCPIFDKNPTTVAAKPMTTHKPEMPMPAFNWNITIKEITKPTEIRITDDNKPKTKPLIPTRKSTTESPNSTTEQPAMPSSTAPTTTTTTAAASSATTTTDAPTSAHADGKRVVENSPLSGDNNLKADAEFNNAKAAEKAAADAAVLTSIPAHSGERLKLVASIAYNSVSEKPLAASQQQQTELGERVPELSIRDAVPADKFRPIHMTEVSSAHDRERETVMELSIHDAIPADRFDPLGVEVVSSANDPSKVNIKREYLVTTEGAFAANNGQPETQSERVENVLLPSGYNDALVERIAPDNEPEAAGSDNIYRIIATTDGPSVTESPKGAKTTAAATAATPTTSASATTQGVDSQATPTNTPPTPTATADYASSTPSADANADADANNSTSSFASSTDLTLSSSTTESAQHLEDDDGPPVETNPAYPSLPEDDFSLRDVNFPLVEADDIGEVELKDEQRSIAGSYDLQMHSKRVHDSDGAGGLLALESGSGSGSGNGAIMPAESYIMAMYASSTEGNKLNVPLMYSSEEETSGETSIQNATDFQMGKMSHANENNETTSQEVSLESDSLEAIMSAGSGSGSGELLPAASVGVAASAMKQREYTTPRPMRRAVQELDIDELAQSGDGQLTPPAEDPKLEVESLKLDESREGSDKADKANLRAEKSVEEAAAVVGDADVDAVVQRIQRLYLHRVY